MKMKFIFAWYDLWVGAFWDGKRRRLYLFPVPTLGCWIHFRKKRKPAVKPVPVGI